MPICKPMACRRTGKNGRVLIAAPHGGDIADIEEAVADAGSRRDRRRVQELAADADQHLLGARPEWCPRARWRSAPPALQHLDLVHPSAASRAETKLLVDLLFLDTDQRGCRPEGPAPHRGTITPVGVKA